MLFRSQYGFTARQEDAEVVTDCPTLLAAPAIERSIGLELIERLERADDLSQPSLG